MFFSIAAGTYDGGLLVFNVSFEDWEHQEPNLTHKFAFFPHSGCVSAMACLESVLVTASTDETLKTYDLDSGKEVATVNLDDSELSRVSALALAADSRGTIILFSGHRDGQVAIWNVKKMEVVRKCHSHVGAQISDLSVPKTAQVVLSAAQSSVKLLNVVRATVASTLDFKSPVGQLCCNESGDLAAVTTAKEVIVIGMATGSIGKHKISRMIDGVRSRPCSVSFVGDKHLVVGDSFGRITLLLLDEELLFKEEAVFDLANPRRLKGVGTYALSEFVTIVVTVDAEGTVTLLSLERKGDEVVFKLKGTHDSETRITSTSFRFGQMK